MADSLYRVIEGEYLEVGDGDTVRFRPRYPERLEAWFKEQAVNVAPQGSSVPPEGSVSLRFQGIDTPELHYPANRSCFFTGKGRPELVAPSFAQPLGRQAQQVLNAMVGLSEHVQSAPGIILAEGADGFGRLISYALPPSFSDGLVDNSVLQVGPELLARTLNCAMLDKGLAYPLAYSSMPAAHRELFREHATRAKRRAQAERPAEPEASERTIWDEKGDTTREFRLRDEGSIDQLGRLIYPKLFRRCIDYLFAVNADDFRGTLREWIVKTNGCKRGKKGEDRSQDDRVLFEGRTGERRLSELVQCEGEYVRFNADLFRLVFVDTRSAAGGSEPEEEPVDA